LFGSVEEQPDKQNKPNQPDQLNEPDKPNKRFYVKLTCFEDLDCWQEARELTRQVYAAINRNALWQKDFRLGGQIQNAAGSVMANIAEGFARRSNKEFVQFLFIAISSSAEVQSHLYIAVDQGYVSKEAFDSLYGQAEKTSRIISGLIKYLLGKQTPQTKRTK
jgi:four helix bundle protein